MEMTINQVLEKAIVEQNKGNDEKAEQLYRIILKAEPKHPQANHNFGVLNVSLKQMEAGLEFLKTALDEDPNQEQFWISYIAALINEGKFKEAKINLNEAENKGFRDKKFEDLKLSLNSTKAPPSNVTNNLLKSFQKKDYSRAVEQASSIIKNFPDYSLSWKILGVILGEIGQIDKALILNNKAVQLDPKDSDSHNNLGLILSKLNRFEESEKSFREAIKLNPNHNLAHLNLGIALRGLGKLDEAEVSYRHAIKLNSNNGLAHYNLGVILVDLKRNEEAELSFNKTLELNPDYKDALFGRGKILFDKRDFEAALKDFDACDTKKSRTRSLETLYALGRIEDIYKRIELQSELDDENIAFASFSTFIAEKQKKDTAHKFCKNPMDFIYYSNLSSHVENSNLFINEVIDELQNIRTHWEPQNKTTHNGSQSILNIFDKPSEKIFDLKSIILNELDHYKSKFKNESCSYIKKWPSQKNLFGWHVVLKQQGYQDPHIHQSGWLSGTIYIKVVPPLKNNAWIKHARDLSILRKTNIRFPYFWDNISRIIVFF